MLPTVTIESTRLFSTFDMGMMLGGLAAVAAIAWIAMTRGRHHR